MSPRETTIQTRTVAHETVEIVRLDWPDGGVLYDVYLRDGDELHNLNEFESLEKIPDDDAIADMITAYYETRRRET